MSRPVDPIYTALLQAATLHNCTEQEVEDGDVLVEAVYFNNRVRIHRFMWTISEPAQDIEQPMKIFGIANIQSQGRDLLMRPVIRNGEVAWVLIESAD